MSDLELYVLEWNIARYTRLLGTETDERVRKRIAALLDDAQQKLRTAVAARRLANATTESSAGV